MKNNITAKLRIYKFTSIIVLLLGALLITYMIIIENELGAIPLIMFTIGIIWFVINEIRIKKYFQKTKVN